MSTLKSDTNTRTDKREAEREIENENALQFNLRAQNTH